MKPKTKLHEKVVALSALLPEISPKAKALAHEKCFDKQAVRVRKRIYCLECGHSWIDCLILTSSLFGCDCPDCGNHLEMIDSYKPFVRHHAYYCSITHIKNTQVVRMFYVTKIYHKNRKSECFSKEVMQHWINESGKITTMACKTQTMSIYYDQWVNGSDMEVRGDGSRTSSLVNISPYYILPGRKVLSILKRNGFTGNFHSFPPQILFSLILKNNKAETLLKTNQIPLLRFLDKQSNIVSTYWPSVRICIRNNYLVNNPSLWVDYLRMLAFSDKDLNNAKYVCPEDLRRSHDILMDRRAKIEARTKREELLQKITSKQKAYEKAKKKFFGLQFEKENLTIKPFESVIQFYDEGEKLRHCVYHSRYFEKKNSLLFSARIDDIPMETVEVTLKPLAIVQSRGLQNKPSEYHGQILNLLQKNLHVIAQYT